MSPRDTSTGRILEQIVLPALRGNGYKFAIQQMIGASISGGRHFVDVLVELPNGREILVSMKWQQVSGTAEEKVPFEVLKLIHAIKNSNGRFQQAYLVLGGEGWKAPLKAFYLSGDLSDYILDSNLVRIVSLETFISLTNRKAL